MSLLRVTASEETNILATGQIVTEIFDQKVLHSYTEPPVSSKYKPLRHNIGAYNYDDTSGKGLNGDQFIIKSSYGNNLVYFTMTNDRGIKGLFSSMTKIMNFSPTYAKQVYDDLKRIYLNSETGGFLLGSNPVKKQTRLAIEKLSIQKSRLHF